MSGNVLQYWSGGEAGRLNGSDATSVDDVAVDGITVDSDAIDESAVSSLVVDVSAVEAGLISLLESCAYRSKRRVMLADWDILRRGDDVLELTLADPQVIHSRSGAETRVNGMIVSLLAPPTTRGFMLARHDDVYYSPFFGCDDTLFESLRSALATH